MVLLTEALANSGECDRENDGYMADSGGKRGCHMAFFTLGINLSTLQWLLYLTRHLVRSVN